MALKAISLESYLFGTSFLPEGLGKTLNSIMAKIKWSKYIPHSPTVKQIKALQSDKKEILFGGALGGGKSDLLLMACLQYMDIPGYASAIFRRQLSDLKQPGALLDRTSSWLMPFTSRTVPKSHRVVYVPSEHTYKFPTTDPLTGLPGEPAKLVFCYSGESHAKDRYQSAEYQTVCFDELSHWETSDDYEWLLTRLRKTVCSIHGKKPDGKPNYTAGCPQCALKKMMPVRMLGATNPGGRGGAWIKNYFSIRPDPTTYPDKRDAIAAIMAGIKVKFVGTHPDRAFIPSFLEDNPFLDQEDYDKILSKLPEEMRSALRDGNWEARVDSRFKRRDAVYYTLYSNMFQIGPKMFSFDEFVKVFITVDPAGTLEESMVGKLIRPKKSSSHSVISVWAADRNNNLYWLDMRRFKDEIPVVVDEICQMVARWKPHFPNIYAKMETNGVGLGPAQYVKKAGIPVKPCKKSKDKIENSTAAGLLLRARKIFFPHNASWIDEAEDEIFAWSGLPNEADDIIDTLSDAANELGVVAETIDMGSLEAIKQNTFSSSMYKSFKPNMSPTLSMNRKSHPLKGF